MSDILSVEETDALLRAVNDPFDDDPFDDDVKVYADNIVSLDGKVYVYDLKNHKVVQVELIACAGDVPDDAVKAVMMARYNLVECAQ